MRFNLLPALVHGVCLVQAAPLRINMGENNKAQSSSSSSLPGKTSAATDLTGWGIETTPPDVLTSPLPFSVPNIDTSLLMSVAPITEIITDALPTNSVALSVAPVDTAQAEQPSVASASTTESAQLPLPTDQLPPPTENPPPAEAPSPENSPPVEAPSPENPPPAETPVSTASGGAASPGFTASPGPDGLYNPEDLLKEAEAQLQWWIDFQNRINGQAQQQQMQDLRKAEKQQQDLAESQAQKNAAALQQMVDQLEAMKSQLPTPQPAQPAPAAANPAPENNPAPAPPPEAPAPAENPAPVPEAPAPPAAEAPPSPDTSAPDTSGDIPPDMSPDTGSGSSSESGMGPDIGAGVEPSNPDSAPSPPILVSPVPLPFTLSTSLTPTSTSQQSSAPTGFASKVPPIFTFPLSGSLPVESTPTTTPSSPSLSATIFVGTEEPALPGNTGMPAVPTQPASVSINTSAPATTQFKNSDYDSFDEGNFVTQNGGIYEAPYSIEYASILKRRPLPTA
ncbi:hypothetical protein TRICI_003491 [Trichomonascus ciferrii]|uniref:Uncharacterized protein n=1 Tax=Trichomonascus ciferrii TaxID=44093 RepID=A0A642V8S1_9ASCO|nr:hypothetical protein TRICI_003491 [Trichomonascus ciferrii]